jgi:putative hemolysin
MEMDSIIIGIEILIIIILILLNGLFSLAEIAVVSTRRIRMQKIADD